MTGRCYRQIIEIHIKSAKQNLCHRGKCNRIFDKNNIPLVTCKSVASVWENLIVFTCHLSLNLKTMKVSCCLQLFEPEMAVVSLRRKVVKVTYCKPLLSITVRI